MASLVKETIWFRVSVWGKQAESTNQYLKKGSKVLVEGRLTPDPATGGPKIWTRQDGTAGATFEVNAATVRFLSSRGDGDAFQGGPDAAPAPIAEMNHPLLAYSVNGQQGWPIPEVTLVYITVF